MIAFKSNFYLYYNLFTIHLSLYYFSHFEPIFHNLDEMSLNDRFSCNFLQVTYLFIQLEAVEVPSEVSRLWNFLPMSSIQVDLDPLHRANFVFEARHFRSMVTPYADLSHDSPVALPKKWSYSIKNSNSSLTVDSCNVGMQNESSYELDNLFSSFVFLNKYWKYQKQVFCLLQ